MSREISFRLPPELYRGNACQGRPASVGTALPDGDGPVLHEFAFVPRGIVRSGARMTPSRMHDHSIHTVCMLAKVDDAPRRNLNCVLVLLRQFIYSRLPICSMCASVSHLCAHGGPRKRRKTIDFEHFFAADVTWMILQAHLKHCSPSPKSRTHRSLVLTEVGSSPLAAKLAD